MVRMRKPLGWGRFTCLLDHLKTSFRSAGHHLATVVLLSPLWANKHISLGSLRRLLTRTHAHTHPLVLTPPCQPARAQSSIFAHRWKEKPRLSRRELRHFWMRTSVCLYSPVFSVHFSCNSVYLPKYESAEPSTPSCSSGLSVGLRLKHFRSVITLTLSVKAGKETFKKMPLLPPPFWSQF